MQNGNLHKLGKTDLFTIIYEQQKEIESLKANIKDLEEQLSNRTITIKEAGSIAEASLKLNKIFETAQEAANQYLESIKFVNKSSDFQDNVHANDKNLKHNSEDNLNIDHNNFDAEPEKNQSLMVTQLSLSTIKLNIFIQLFKLTKEFFISLKIKTVITFSNFRNRIKNLFNMIVNAIKKLIKFIKNIITKLKEKSKNKEVRLKKILNRKYITNITDDINFSIEELEEELNKRKLIQKRIVFIRSFFFSCIVVIAIAIVTATSFFKVLQVNGSSMEPTLIDGQLLITSKFFNYKKGDMIAFFYNDRVLIKRIIAMSGDTVNMDDDGTVYVNNEKQKEDYVSKLDYGKCNITFPYVVPKDTVFVLGDNRKISLDSRSTSIGCIIKDNIIGKIEFRLKPFTVF